MSESGLPLSRRHLDIAIEKLADRFGEAQRVRRAVANTIVAQLMPACVIKGGSSLKFRYGDIATRVTKDMDAAQGDDLDAFIVALDDALRDGWHGFTGHVVRREPAKPADVPAPYVMHPFDVKLEYNRKPWMTVRLEMGANEVGDTLDPDLDLSPDIVEMFEVCPQNLRGVNHILQEYINLRPVLRVMMLNPKRFLSPIKRVEVAHA